MRHAPANGRHSRVSRASRRCLLVGLGCVTLAACGSRQDNDATVAGSAAKDVANLAFQYSYTLRLPSAKIDAAQSADAQRCERLGAPRCRITGMTYNVDSSGEANATLAVATAAPLARAFGREGVDAVERAGGMLAGAQISGTDTAPDTAAGDTAATRNTADLQRIDRQLARVDLSDTERAELNSQRAAAVEAARAGSDSAAAARGSAATTPVSFTYQAGRGVGAAAELGDAGQTAYASLLTTLSVLLTALAVLGPPALLLLVLFLLWRRFGAPVWRRLFPAHDHVQPIETTTVGPTTARIVPPPA